MRWVRIPIALFVILVALLLQQGYFSLVQAEETPKGEIFADVSRSAGITHNRQGTIKATGQAWGDYDNDGWLDLYVTDTDGPNVLYRNNDDCDLFAFRTPPLRNVALTGPWMHNGTYTSIEGAIRHHLDPATALRNYDPSQLPPEFQDLVFTDPDVIAAQLTCPSAPTEVVELSDEQIADLLAFLDTLTSPSAIDLSHIVPEAVPSGLTVGGQ